ncbi:MAG: ABC transporter ATP-binding protein [Prolixibacteraceae bacterium]|nr:ABC transporter ATP-binding protein [Prolixibacteraceae bacterium]
MDNRQNASICCSSVSKSFGKTKVLDDINFEVKHGEIFGVIGPDGAGKTTLYRILTTLLNADEGTAYVNGFDIVSQYKEIRRRVGYMPGRFSLYHDLTVEENLTFFATVFNSSIEENYYLIEDIYKQIEPFKDRRAGKLSGGMKQKLALCCALIHKPEVLFLDEPTTGVDPVSRKEFWGMLMKLKSQGITILVSTPYMDEAKLCDRIAFILNGKVLKIDVPQKIISSYKNEIWAVKSRKMSKLLSDIRSFGKIESCYSFGDSHHVEINTDHLTDASKSEFRREMEIFLKSKGHEELTIVNIDPSIEDVFMSLSRNDYRNENNKS